MAAAFGAGENLRQGTPLAFRFGFAQRQFGLGGQPGKGGAQLVGGIGNEALLGHHYLLEAPQQIVHGADQRPDFIRRPGCIQLAQVVAVALGATSWRRRSSGNNPCFSAYHTAPTAITINSNWGITMLAKIPRISA